MRHSDLNSSPTFIGTGFMVSIDKLKPMFPIVAQTIPQHPVMPFQYPHCPACFLLHPVVKTGWSLVTSAESSQYFEKVSTLTKIDWFHIHFTCWMTWLIVYSSVAMDESNLFIFLSSCLLLTCVNLHPVAVICLVRQSLTKKRQNE